MHEQLVAQNELIEEKKKKSFIIYIKIINTLHHGYRKSNIFLISVVEVIWLNQNNITDAFTLVNV